MEDHHDVSYGISNSDENLPSQTFTFLQWTQHASEHIEEGADDILKVSWPSLLWITQVFQLDVPLNHQDIQLPRWHINLWEGKNSSSRKQL